MLPANAVPFDRAVKFVQSIPSYKNRVTTSVQNFFARITESFVSGLKTLKDWSWTKLTSIAWIKNRYESRILANATNKLDGTQRTKDNLLSLEECRVSLQAILESVKASNEIETPTRYQQFVSHLKAKQYLRSPQDQNDKNLFVQQLQVYLANFEKRYGFDKELLTLEQYLNSSLLLPTRKQEPLQFSKEEIRLLQCCNPEANTLQCFNPETNTLESIDPTQAFQTLLKVLRNSEKVIDYDKMANLFINEPFLVGNELVSKHSRAFHKLLDVNEDRYISIFLFTRIKEMAQELDRLGDLTALKQSLEKQPTGIQTAVDIGHISLFVTHFIDQIQEEKLNSDEKTLLEILKRFPYRAAYNPKHEINRWLFLEQHLKEVRSLRCQIEGKKKLQLHQIPFYLKILSLTQSFTGFMTTNPNWPCEILQELSTWISLVPKGCVGLDEGQEEFFASSKNAEIPFIIKMKKAIEVQKITEEQKLSLKEFFLFKELCKKLDPLKEVIDPEILDVFNKYQDLLMDSSSKPFIRVCLLQTNDRSEERVGEWDSWKERLCKRITSIVKEVFCFFFPYRHVNFLEFDGSVYYAHGLGEKIYHDQVTGHYHPLIEAFDINSKALLPCDLSAEKTEEFGNTFFHSLQEIIHHAGEGLHFPKNQFQRFFKGKLPQRQPQKVERFLTKDEKREIFCSEFVLQAIVEAQIATCEAMQLPAPSSLSFFGTNKLDGIGPSQLKSILLQREILRPLPELVKR